MWFRSLFNTPKPTRGRAARRPRARGFKSLGLERLEELCLPSFLSPVNYAVGSDPEAVATGDFNNDGRLDLAVSNALSNTVSVLVGNADSTFQSAVSSATGTTPLSVAVGDFNADGKLDLVTANAADVTVLLGNGNGTFQAPVPAAVEIGTNPQSVAVGDFNGDGKLDLGVASNVYVPGYPGWYGGWYPGWYEGRANVLLGTCTGSFGAPIASALSYGYRTTAAAADLNADGKADLVVGSDGGSVSVLLGTATGVQPPSTTYAPPVKSVALGDFNGDGKVDAVVANAYLNNVSVLPGNGLGTLSFDPVFTHATDSTPASVALADLNGDGKIDVVAADVGGKVNVLLGTGTGSFRPALTAPAGGYIGVATGDFNGDARRDVATLGSDKAWVSLNDGVWPALDAPTLAVNDVTVKEGNTGTTNATFTVSLSAASTKSVTVRYATQDGTATAGNDFQATSGVLTFSPGTTSLTVSVPVVGDRAGEPYESFALAFTDPTNAFILDATGSGNIVDDEPVASIDYGPVYVTEGNSGTTAATFTVRLAAAYDAPVRVNYSTFEGDTDFPYWGPYGIYYGPPEATAGTDFETNVGTVTFAPGETVKTVVVAVKGDVTSEDDEYFSLNLTGSPDATLGAQHAVAAILDDEPRASVGEASVTEGNTGTKTITFTVTLSSPPTAPVTVTYDTQDGSATAAGGDYQAKTGTVTFGIGETSKTVTVLVNGDRLGEYDEYFYLRLTEATGAVILNGYGQGTILDNEARISISSASITEGNKGTKTMTFTVSLAASYDQTVTVKFATYDWSTTAGVDYVAKSGTLTFLPGETTKTITIAIKGDTRREYDETFVVQLEEASSNALVYEGSGWGTILDDDRPRQKRKR